ncbi:CAP domain-containing protein [Guptibacillus hwajinpoensis]|uniref:CAP domain-containing protein n=1 Tax=Guptibacillus hwajinpoensis TaxID=208199 RepID=UPI001CD49A9F|nr:CAP domain-containing protein [Pseudalkalibacillus hwajinpoensis]MCA0989814.1 CAP domain-containing protein [Pseudalkalibacillus hwajinpoensis]
MKKSIILGVTAAAALLAANPSASSASEGNQFANAEVKAQTFQVNNINELQSILDRFEKQYNISINDSINLDQLLQQATEQADQAPKAEAPVEEKAEAPKAKAPVEKAEAPEAKAPVEEKAEAPAETEPVPSESNQAEQAEPTKETEAETGLSEFEQQVVNLTNEERAKAGLSALEVDTELSKVAQAKSEDMRDNNYFAHNSPTYGSPFDMMNQFGVDYQSAGENIAKGQQTPEEVVNAWMNSEGHRKNIMNGSFTHIGVGYVEEGNIWTQQFIGK